MAKIPEGKTAYPLTSAQRMLLWAERFSLEPKKVGENNIIAAYMKIDNAADLSALEKALNYTLEFYDSLRLRVVRTWRGLRQYIQDPAWRAVEIVSVPDDQAFRAFLETTYQYPVSWRDPSMVWARIVRIGPSGAALVLRMHHMCLDGYSVKLIFDKLESAYTAFAAGEAPAEEKRYSVVKFFEFQQKYLESPAHKADRKYWWKAYNSQPHYSFPAGYRSEIGLCDSRQFLVQGGQYQALLALCRKTECSLQSAMMTLAAITTCALTGKKNFCIFSLTHGRLTLPLKKTVGCMMNNFPVFYRISAESTLQDAVKNGYMELLEALSHGRFPMGEQVPLSYPEAIRHFGNFNHAWMLFSSMEYGALFEQSGHEMDMIRLGNMAYQFYITMLDVPGKHISFDISWQTRKFTPGQISHVIAAYQAIIGEIAAGRGETVGELMQAARKAAGK